jgi:hypothetical protein
MFRRLETGTYNNGEATYQLHDAADGGLSSWCTLGWPVFLLEVIHFPLGAPYHDDDCCTQRQHRGNRPPTTFSQGRVKEEVLLWLDTCWAFRLKVYH